MFDHIRCLAIDFGGTLTPPNTGEDHGNTPIRGPRVADDLTVNAHADHGQGARINHILLGPAIVPGSYHVWVSDLGDRASDHRMISVRNLHHLP